MPLKLLYCFGISLLFITACDTPKEIFITKDFEKNNRSAEIKTHYFKDALVNFLEFRAYKDSCIQCSQTDSNTNFGLIAARVTFRMYNNKKEMYFGNDSVKCVIQYSSFSKYQITEAPAIDLFSKRKIYDPKPEPRNEKTDSRAEGTIQIPDIKNTFPFFFHNYSGYLLINKDSFKLSPIMQGKWKPMQTLIGVQLIKGDTVYGAIHSFTGLFRKKVFLYTKATEEEQLIIAAYFAVIFWQL